MSARNFDSHLRRLSRYLPIPNEIVFVRDMEKSQRCIASCWKTGGRFRIEIDAGLDDRGKRDCLLHEWAHALCWSEEYRQHDLAWGVAFSRCYRVAVEGWRPSF